MRSFLINLVVSTVDGGYGSGGVLLHLCGGVCSGCSRCAINDANEPRATRRRHENFSRDCHSNKLLFTLCANCSTRAITRKNSRFQYLSLKIKMKLQKILLRLDDLSPFFLPHSPQYSFQEWLFLVLLFLCVIQS